MDEIVIGCLIASSADSMKVFILFKQKFILVSSFFLKCFASHDSQYSVIQVQMYI